MPAEPPPRRIAVFRALQLGDMLCSVPAFRALRGAFPEAEITLVGLPWAASFVERFNRYIDAFVEFPGYPGLPEREPDTAALGHFIDDMRERRFDLAIQLHGSGSIVNPLVASLGASRTAGFFPAGSPCPDPSSFVPWPDDLNEIDRYLCLTEHLGVASRGRELEFPLRPSDYADLDADEELRALPPRGYVCIHPGARLKSRRWPAERFAEVARAVAREGWPVVLTGTAEEAPIVAEVAQALDAPAVIAAGRTTLGTMAVLLSRARLVVSNDTGASHIAAAVGTPSVVVACGSDVARWRPLDTARHHVVWTPLECRPCAFDDCPIGHPCATRIDADEVLRHAHMLLGATG